MSHPSPPAPPSAASLAELAHRSTRGLAEPLLVFVALDAAAEEVELGIGPLPDGHPADALVGFRAPATWDAVGIVGTGTIHDLGAAPAASRRGRFTTLARRDGSGASVIEDDDGHARTLVLPPEGWVADVLARVLGRPAAPPAGSSALLIDVWWLDELVAGVLARPDRRPSWRALAAAHPLCPPGTIATPAELRERTLHEALARPWSRLRALARGAELPAARSSIPAGEVLSGDRWFDDGTLCRWLLRRTLPPEALVAELVHQLPVHLVDQLAEALVEVELPAVAA